MATKKTEITKDQIITYYMDYVLEHNAKPKSIYHFTKENNFSEAQLYAFFGTLEAIEKEIFIQFFDKTVELLEKNPAYASYDMRGKLLSFYFTFFELLTANRSYVLYALQQHKNQLKNVMLLGDVRKKFKNYIGEITTDDFRIQIERFQEYQEKATKESLWIQLLLTLKFWMEDSSAGFEKTDIYIEKSVKAAFELINITPIDSLIDFGKFLFKEKIQKN
jgi:hypothetical protein